MARSDKLVLLGVCSASPDVILRQAASGELPTFRWLESRGLSARTQSVPGLFVGSTWPSVQTGVNPARHGCHYTWRVAPGSYEFRRCRRVEQIRREPFWVPLARAGRKLVLLDLPHTNPIALADSTQLIEWGGHAYDFGQLRSWPVELTEEVQEQFGPPPARESCDDFRNLRGLGKYRDALIGSVAQRAELTTHFLRRQAWDFFAQVFSESHCAGHQFWHLHDRSHPRHGAWAALRAGDPLLDVYRSIDAAIGEILEHVPERATVIVLISHGMGPHYSGQFMLDEILGRLGVAQLASSPARRRASNGPVCPFSAIEPAASDVFRVDNNSPHSGLRVNRAGREPDGRVHASSFDSFCEKLQQDLLDIVNVDTGNPVLQSVARADRLYHGEHLDELPDLLLEWSNEAPVRRIRSGKIGEITGELRSARSGHHTRDGLLFAFGPGVPVGRLDRVLSIMDIAPTITKALGIELPDVDGRAVDELH